MFEDRDPDYALVAVAFNVSITRYPQKVRRRTQRTISNIQNYYLIARTMKPSLIILLSILSAAAVLAIGFVIIHGYQSQYRAREVLPPFEPKDAQVDYMREVRRRDREDLAAISGHSRRYW